MTRRNLTILFLAAALVLALAGALAWMQRTEAGARWIWSHASVLVPGSLRAEDIRGDLRSGLTLQAVTFENESTSVAGGTVQLRLGFDLFPPALSIESLVVDRIVIRNLPQADVAPGKLLADKLSALYLPLPLNFASIRIGQLLYQGVDGATAIESSELSLSGQWHEGMRMQEAKLRTPAAEWHIRGRIGFRSPFPVDATVDSRIQLPASGTSSPPTIHIETILKGNLSDLEVRAMLEQPAVSVQGHILHLLQQPSWDLRLLAEALQWPLDSDAPQVTLHQLSAHSSGSWPHYELEASGALGLRGLPVMPADLRGEGDAGGIQIDQLHLSGEQIQLAAHGPVSWTDGLRIELASVIDRLDPGLWLATWPADHPLRGNLELDWRRDRLALHSFDLAAHDNGFSVRGKGELDLAADIAEGELEWKSLRWPVGASQAEFSSEHGSVQVHGKPADWSVAGTLQLQAGQWPDGLLTIAGKGDLESVQVLIEKGEVLGGSFAGQFNYRWADKSSWSTSVNAQDLDISPLSSAFPGVISGIASARGHGEPVEFDVDIERLDGIVRGQPITASGGISFKTGELLARDLQLQSGQSNLVLDGSAQSAAGMSFSGRIESLGQWIEGASGSIAGKGRFSADPEHPQIELELQGSELWWGDWRVATITASQRQDAGDPAATRIELTGLSFGDQQVEALSLTLSGKNLFDDIRLEAHRNATLLQARLAGSVHDWTSLPKARWEGKIQSLRIDNETLGFLQLEQAAGLALALTALEVGPACLRGSRNGRICLNATWKDGDNLMTRARLEGISLNLVQLFLGQHLDFSQTLSGELRWQQPAGGKPSGEARIELSPGHITFENEDATLNTGSGLLAFTISDGRLQSGNMNIVIPGTGSINSDFTAPDISRGVDSAIDGRIRLDLQHIEPLLNWVPVLADSIAGSVNADIRLSGTLTDPRFTGHASLVRGRFEYAASGTVISDIQLAGAVYDFNYTEFNGSFKAGEGQGRIKAAVKFDNVLKPDITLELSGRNLSLVNVPDMMVIVDLDLRTRWHDSLLNLDGSILIPHARISPRYLPSDSATESPDLVIVGGEPVIAEESFFDRSKLRVNGSVAVELGKDVTVTLEKATARLHGKAVFKWDDNVLPMADGNYTLSGKISSYGQLLEVADGRVYFPHVPADDPHLNINAEREIYGNLQIKQAGVHITGTLKQPTLEPYTTPVTTRERALALLVTGHDFDYDQGVGGIEAGLYIAPRLFVSYGLGLFESQNVISARYDLKHGFGIKATSGQRETGADISYTIEH